MEFAKNLRAALLENNITQSKLAARLGTTQATVSRWLTGVNEPDLSTLIEICLFLNESPSSLLGFNDIFEERK